VVCWICRLLLFPNNVLSCLTYLIQENRTIYINVPHKAIIHSFDVDNSNKTFFVWFFVIPQQNKQKYLLIKLFSVRRTYIIKEHNSIIASLVSSRRPPCCCSGRPIGGAAAPLFIHSLQASSVCWVATGQVQSVSTVCCVVLCVIIILYYICYLLPVTCRLWVQTVQKYVALFFTTWISFLSPFLNCKYSSLYHWAFFCCLWWIVCTQKNHKEIIIYIFIHIYISSSFFLFLTLLFSINKYVSAS